MNNQEIREAAKAQGVRLWQIAEALGMADSNFSRKLRHELPQDEKSRILRIIEAQSAPATGIAGRERT